MAHSVLIVAANVCCLIGSQAALPEEFDFPPLLCDRPSFAYAKRVWQQANMPDFVSGVTFSIGWRETSLDPSKTQLDASFVAIANLGKPWKLMYDKVKDGVAHSQSCETVVTLPEWNKNRNPPDETDFSGRVDIEYHACVNGNRLIGTIDTKSVRFGMRISTQLVEGAPVVTMEPSFHANDPPDLFKVLGIFAPFQSAFYTKSFNDEMKAFRDQVFQFDKTISPAKDFKEITDLYGSYKPKFGHPFFMYMVANPNDTQDDSSLLWFMPLTMTVPHEDVCKTKVSIYGWAQEKFDSRETDNPDIPFLLHFPTYSESGMSCPDEQILRCHFAAAGNSCVCQPR
jgi:hypothetical protein